MKKQKEYKETIPQLIKPSFEENSTLPYLGKNYALRILKRQLECDIRLIDGEFIIKIKSSNKFTNTAEVRKRYNYWLMENAKSLFKNKLKETSERLDVKPRKIIIKTVKKIDVEV